jgi:DNA-binding response OmpR family regulator
MTGGNAYWASSLVAAKQLGAVATLMKPFSAAELLSAVNIALARPGGAAS